MSAGTATWVALAAAGVAVLALALALGSWFALRRARAAYQVLLSGGKADVVDFAVSLQARIDDLQSAVDELAAGLGGWLAAPEDLRQATRAAMVAATRERYSWDGVARTVIAAARGELDDLPLP